MTGRELRHRLGSVKHRILEGSHARRQLVRAEEFRESSHHLVWRLPPIRRASGVEAEVHMLCGRAHLDMGVVSSWSVLRFLPGAVLYVHSDGTLTEDDVAAWRRVVEPLEFVQKDVADKVVTESLRDAFPNVLEWRMKNWAAYQLTDYALFGTTSTVISCDTDVLFFSKPGYLVQHLDDSAMRWNEDIRSCYAADLEVLRSATGLTIPKRLNCGLTVMPRVTDEGLATCETAITRLRAVPGFDANHPYSSQTYLAFVAATQEGAGPLPPEYSVYRGRTRSTSVARHYVGVPSIRSRYFLEGWPALFEQAGLT